MKTNPKDATPIRPVKRDSAPERPSGSYAALPDAVTGSPSFVNLGDAAVRLLLELVRHHDGYNNGLLHTTYTALRGRGLGSQSKVQKAFVELIEAGFIVKTRGGGINAGPDTYALTWLPATSKDRTGNPKDMPLLPKPYPINKFLLASTAPKEKTLRGAARQSRSAKMEREIHSDDAPSAVATSSNSAPCIGNTVLLSPGGTVKRQKTTKTVPPQDTDHSVPGYRLSRPAIPHCAAGEYGFDKFRTARRFRPPFRVTL